MKSSPLLVLIAIALFGCATSGPNDPPCKDPLHKTYQAYSGEQNWPIASGSFVTMQDQIPIYHGPPDRPYDVLGRAVRRDVNLRDLARCCRSHRGDAVCIIIQERLILGVKHDPGLVIPVGRGFMTLPGSDKADIHTVTTAQIIKFKSP